MALTKPKKGPGRPRDEALQERRRAQIVDAAAESFARDGYRTTDLQRVADSLELAKGTIYRYFKTKEELFLAAVERGVQLLHEYITAAICHVRDPMERIAGAVRAYLAYFRAHPGLVELFIQERAEFRERGTPTYFRRRDAKKALWEEMFRELVAAGRLRDLPPRRALDLIGEVLYGAMFVNHVAARARPEAEHADDIVDLIFFGLAGESERGRFRK